MPAYTFTFITIFLFLFSCTSDKTKNSSLYTVTRTDFEDKILISGQTEPVNSVTLVCPRNVDGIVNSIVEDGTYVKEGDAVCVIEDVNISTNYDTWFINLENARAELEKLKADLNMEYALLEAQVRNNEAETQIAGLDSLQLEYLTPSQRKIKELELEKTAVDKVRFQKKLDALEIIQQSDVKRQEINIQRMERRVETAKEMLDNLTIRATRDGLALRAKHYTGNILQTGDPVWTSRPLVILPDLEKMQVKIFAPESEYKRININDSIIYTFDAMPDNMAWGKILQKAPIGIPRSNNSKVKFFEITASVDSAAAPPDAGLSTNCNVYLRALKDTIVIPSLTVFDSDSLKVVYVKQKNGFEMREIQTGLSTHRNTVVAAGLNENECIAFTRPAEKMIKSRKLLPKGTTAKPVSITNADKHKNP